MKNAILNLAGALCIGLFSTNAFAQNENSKVKIRVEKTENGKTQVIEKELNVAGKTQEETDQLIESLQDSLIGDLGQNKKIKITIDDDRQISMDNEDSDFEWHGGGNLDSRNPNVYIYKKKRGKGGDQELDEFHWDMNDFTDKMRYLGEEIPRRIERNLPKIYSWNDQMWGSEESEAIRSLDVYPNRPETDIINVRFYAPEEGDVQITVLDINGKTVAQENSKAFKGEYVGQVKLKKGATGTYFVIVSQGDDGISRRVKL